MAITFTSVEGAAHQCHLMVMVALTDFGWIDGSLILICLLTMLRLRVRLGVNDITVADMVGGNGKWRIDMFLLTLGRNMVDRTQGCAIPSNVPGGDAVSWGSTLLGQFLLPHSYLDFASNN